MKHSPLWSGTSSRAVALASILLAVLFLVLGTPGSAEAQRSIIYVDADATGLSWTDAFTNVQNALDAASSDEISVAAGVYTPTQRTDANDARSATFQLASGVALYGGFDPGSGADAWNERNWSANATILSGDIGSNDTNNDGNHIAKSTSHIQGNNAYHVVTGSGTDDTTVLDGFTITAGLANGVNGSDNVGGGMVNGNGNLTLANVTFSGNAASNFDVAGVAGGGLYNETGSPTLINITFSGNSASGSSGGGQGGGLYTLSGTPTIQNSILWNNRDDSGTGTADASLYGGTPTIRYSLVQGWNLSSDGNLDGTNPINDPLFVNMPDPASAPTTTEDLRLRLNSPAIDAGDSAADLDGGVRSRPPSPPFPRIWRATHASLTARWTWAHTKGPTPRSTSVGVAISD